MAARPLPVVRLSEMQVGQEADLFALLAAKQPLTTRDGKPYLKLTFRDHAREVSFPLWQDTPLYQTACEEWQPGRCYKLRATYRETQYGPQLDLSRVRAVEPQELPEGMSLPDLLPHTSFDVDEMWGEMLTACRESIGRPGLSALVVDLLETHRAAFVEYPAAVRNHHTYRGGLLEHTRNTVRIARYLASTFQTLYPALQPPLDGDLVVAGALLHDLGKLRELQLTTQGAELTAAGGLVGHAVLGRDMLREAAGRHELDAELLTRLEHVLLAHQRVPEGAGAAVPLTAEGLLVQFADDLDARYAMYAEALAGPTENGPFTTRRNILGQTLYRGGGGGA